MIQSTGGVPDCCIYPGDNEALAVKASRVVGFFWMLLLSSCLSHLISSHLTSPHAKTGIGHVRGESTQLAIHNGQDPILLLEDGGAFPIGI